MAKKHGPNKENLEATRRVFLKIAREEFSTQGYYNASTANIVKESGMARGSLYYHFGDKKGLFRAVYEELMEEMQAAVKKNSEGSKDAWDALMAGCLTVLDLCTEKQTRRIIVDVHTAIPYPERLEILGRTLIYELQIALRGSMELGYFKGHDIRSLGIIIFGIISEGSRSFELTDNVAQAREDIGKAFVLFMNNVRAAA
jgi:AcrR family transcriptional regulator